MMHEPRQQRGDIGPDDDLVVVGRVPLRHVAGVFGLVVERVDAGKADRVGADRRVGQLRHGVHDRRGVETPAEKGSERDVADQLHADRALEQLVDAFFLRRLRQLAAVVGLERPIPLHRHARRIREHVMRRRDLADRRQQRRRRRDVAVAEEIGGRLAVERSWNRGVREDRLDLRGEHQPRGPSGT